MTGKERILTVLNHKKADRVPTYEWSFYPGLIQEIAGYESDVRFVQEYDLDAIAITLDRRIRPIDDGSFVDEFGVIRAYSDEYPSPLDYPIKSAEDLRTFVMPDPDDEAIYKTMLNAINEVGQEKAVIARIRDVFSFPRDMLGYENFMMDLILEPELVEDLMSMSVEYSSRVAQNLKQMGVEVVAVLDDIANAAAPLISPEMYREQVFPHFKQLISNFHKTGLKAIKHSDGNLYPILDCLIESGIDCLDPIDPMGGMDLAGILREYGDKISCKGNIDCVHVLVDGTFEEVENAVKECIAAGAVNGGHIISSSNSIHKGISPANYKFMLECIRKYGKHPVNM